MFIKFHKSKQFLYILVFCIPFLFKSIFQENLELINYNIIKSFSCCFLFLIYLIEKKLSKRKSTSNSKLNFKFSKIILLILFIISNLLSLYLTFKYFKFFNIFELEYTFDIYFYFLFTIFFQNKNYYSHHMLSIFISFILLIILLIYYSIKSRILDIFFLFLYITKSYCYSLSLLLTKYINEIYFINIYLLGSINGLFELTFEIIYSIIEKPKILLFDYIYSYSIIFIFYLICNYLFYFILNKYQPIHSLLCGIIVEICIDFIFYLDDIKHFELFFYIIFIFCIMIYLEFIQLNFCGLNTNLKTKIKKRGRLDSNEKISKFSFDTVADLIRNLNF